MSDVLSRVQYKGEHFKVLRNGEVIAELRPSEEAKRAITVADFRREFGDVMVPEGLGADIEDARRALRSLPDVQWPSS